MRTKVRYWRTKKLLSQEILATRAGISSKAVISRLENTGVAQLSTLRKIAQALEIEPEKLTTEDTDPDADGPAPTVLDELCGRVSV